ncbi:MAG: hypothetical protein PHS45_05200 [Bacilli bacterium]|nr:hypothetical protein [Bacilli bacterium]
MFNDISLEESYDIDGGSTKVAAIVLAIAGSVSSILILLKGVYYENYEKNYSGSTNILFVGVIRINYCYTYKKLIHKYYSYTNIYFDANNWNNIYDKKIYE